MPITPVMFLRQAELRKNWPRIDVRHEVPGRSSASRARPPCAPSSVGAVAHLSRSFSCSSLVGQPNQAFSPFAAWPMNAIGSAKRDAGDGGGEDVPAAFGRRLLHGAAREQRAPVHRGEIDVDAGLAQPLRGEQPGRIGEIVVGRLQHDDGLAVIAGLLEQLLGLGDVLPFLEPVGVLVVRHRRAAAEE